MTYLIKQSNSLQRNFEDLPKIMAVTSDVFMPEIGDPELFAKSEIFNYENSDIPWQIFYVMDGQIVAGSLCLFIREASCEGKKDVCITLVNTNPKYRKKGLMEVLFNYIFKMYEKHESYVCKEGYEVSKKTDNECINFLTEFNVNDGYYVLYSIVETYYAKYGFQPFKTLNYFKAVLKSILSEHDFTLRDNEQYINLSNLENFVHNEKYIPFDIVTNDVTERSCNFKTSSILPFAKKLKILLEHEACDLESLGLHIQNDEGESFIIINQHFGTHEVMIQRIYTSVEDKTVLNNHIHRLYHYISHYLKTNYYRMSDNKLDNQWQLMWLSDNDIFTTSKDSKSTIYDYFAKEKAWDYDDTNSEHLAMVREWDGTPLDGLKWTHNGCWSLN